MLQGLFPELALITDKMLHGCDIVIDNSVTRSGGATGMRRKRGQTAGRPGTSDVRLCCLL